MAFEPRIYRDQMNRERFRFFNVVNKETDLWIGISPGDFHEEIIDFSKDKVSTYRECLEQYISENPAFLVSMDPLPIREGLPELVMRMSDASTAASTGPMSAVAGAVAETLGHDLVEEYNPYELIIENGGDIYIHTRDEILVQFYAGQNQYFRNLALSVPPDSGDLGICTSSGMFGHSISYGKADSVTVVCSSAALADAWATAICNKIQTSDDIKFQLAEIKNHPEILSLIAIKDKELGITGKFSLKMI